MGKTFYEASADLRRAWDEFVASILIEFEKIATPILRWLTGKGEEDDS